MPDPKFSTNITQAPPVEYEKNLVPAIIFIVNNVEDAGSNPPECIFHQNRSIW